MKRRKVNVTAPVSPRARRALDRLHEKDLNFNLEARSTRTPERGWYVDDYLQPLPPEAPGPPVSGGSWETARRLLRRYEFVDPSIVRAVYFRDEPLEERNMLLEARFYGLRFHLGLRVGGVIDRVEQIDGQRLQVWGWNYRTLEGHLEMGQMDYEVRKWLDTGEVDFRIRAVSKAARIPNPITRLGFWLFGRRVQTRFARRALERMRTLVAAELEGETGRLVHRSGDPQVAVEEPRSWRAQRLLDRGRREDSG